MAEKFISLRNLQFLLYEHLDAAALTKYPILPTTAKRPSTWSWRRQCG